MSTTTITPSTTTGANQKAIISKILVAIDSSLDYSNKFRCLFRSQMLKAGCEVYLDKYRFHHIVRLSILGLYTCESSHHVLISRYYPGILQLRCRTNLHR